MDTLLFLAPPITISILLAGILGYFGNHILARGIIFIDIAIAQIAALGTMTGIILGFADESTPNQLISYGFTILVLTLFLLMKPKKNLLPQEALIGIFYCIALGAALLLAEKIPGGSNFITKTITGNVLWVTWKKILHCVILLSAVILIHLLLGKKFKEISLNKNHPAAQGSLNLWIDWIFYVTFGIVIVKAVPVQGIFLVFILLIAPAAVVALFTHNWKKKILWSWFIGAAGSVAGILISYRYNISNGPAIVCILGTMVFLLSFYKLATKKSKPI